MDSCKEQSLDFGTDSLQNSVSTHFLTPSFDDLGPGRASQVCFHSRREKMTDWIQLVTFH